MKTPRGYLLRYAWYSSLNGSDPQKWQKSSKIHNFSKIKRIRKIFSGYSSWRAILHFCFLEYRATTLSCYHMGPWYTIHMVPEWYYTKMSINRLKIDWRVIFESISINFSKWLTPLNQYDLESTLYDYINPFKIFQKSFIAKKFSLYPLRGVKSWKCSTLTPT